MFSHSPLDWVLVGLYFVFLALVWLRLIGRPLGASDYLVAGRRVTLPAFVATLVATWYGGILGVGEYSYRYGLANWVVFGVPYYIGALLFAWLLARRARRAELYTIPDLLERRYGRGAALLGAVLVFITSAPAAYVLMLGTLFAAMFGLPLGACIVAAALLSVFYIHNGGLRTVVFTDQIQFLLMYAGFIVIVAFLFAQHGGLGFLLRSVPATHFTWNGGNSAGAIIVWYFIALEALVDPAFWQRAYAARDPQVAQRGVLWSVAFWIFFDFLTTTTGLYARALLPQLHDPVFAFPEIARITLPAGFLGLFYLGMIATVMSTIDSYGFIAAATIGRDFIWRLRREPDEAHVPRYTKLGLWIAAVFATALALTERSVIDLWHDLGSITTPALLLPLSLALGGRGLSQRWTLVAMGAPALITLSWIIAKAIAPASTAHYPWGIEPIYAGLAVSLAIYIAGWAARGRGLRRVEHSAAIAAIALVALAAHPRGASAHIEDMLPLKPRAAADSSARDTLGKIVPMKEVVVSTTRLSDRAPLARSVLNRDAIVGSNLGLDTPMLLSTLPGAYAYSDAGNGIGYSYLTIRGFPQRRISVLVNGVPLNDPESHEVYWIDHPDLLASTAEAQVQRGVGSALYGAASVGGSVDLETGPFGEAPRASAVVAYGDYETKRLMLEMDSGRLNGGYSFYGRYSRIESFGYRDQSWSRLWSYALSARRIWGQQTLRLNLYGGPEETHLAYLGVPRGTLDGGLTGDPDQDRRFNPLTYPNERDHFFEPHYELVHSWAPRAGMTLSQTLFWFDGRGYYDEQRFGQKLTDYRLEPWFTADTLAYPPEYFARDTTGALIRDANGRLLLEKTDVVRRRTVVNRHYGWIPRVKIAHAGGTLTLGGELRAHDGHHYGNVLSGEELPPGTPPDLAYYDFHPHTLSAGIFGREEWNLRPDLMATADLAWRHESYHYQDDRFDGVAFDQPYNFGLPRLGFSWTPSPRASLYAAWSHAEREPALRDLYDGESVGNVPLYAGAATGTPDYGSPLIRPEKVGDWEVGGTWRFGTVGAGGAGSGAPMGLAGLLGAHFFRMDFRDELVYAGQFDTDLGYPILGNAAESIHQGVELEGRVAPPAWGEIATALDANATISDNHFVHFTESYGPTPADQVSYDGKAIGFFPNVLLNATGRVAWKGASATLAAQYAGRQYLDNTETEFASIAPHTVWNLAGALRFPTGSTLVALQFHVLNLFDRQYETGGYMDYDAAGNLVPQFIPAATRHVLGELRVDW